MRHRVRPQAAADIRRIYVQGVELFGTDQAERYAAGLDRTFAMLADHPYAARLRSELQPALRVFRYKAHMIIYEIDRNDVVVILRVRHGHEDWISGPL
jgi:toxin ParE1/3/4